MKQFMDYAWPEIMHALQHDARADGTWREPPQRGVYSGLTKAGEQGREKMFCDFAR